MNSNRNRYSSAPTYGMQKRTPVRKNAPKVNKPKQQPAAQATPQGQAYPNVPYPNYAVNQPMGASVPAQMPQQQMPGYPPYAAGYGYPQEQVVSYPTPSAGGNQTIGITGHPQMNASQMPPPGAYPTPPYPQAYPGTPPYTPQQQPGSPKPRNKDAWLQILVLAILPVLFAVAMILRQPPVYWVFIGFALVGMIAMWLQSSFVSSARTTLSLIYGALLVVSVVSLMSGSPVDDRTTAQQHQTAQTSSYHISSTQQQDPAAMFAGLEDMQNQSGPQAAVADATTPEPSSTTSEAALVLSNFMNLWNANKLDDMVSLCAPSWSSGEESAVKSLYMLLANRRPVDYTIEKITGTDADSSRTITMTSTIDRQNNKAPVKYRFQVLMLKESNAWYVDPQSLASNDKAEDEAAAEGATPSPTPTAAPSSNTKLYYNPDGGSYYHAVDNCYRVDDKYLPLEPFYYKDIENTKFKNLKPCPYCDAPDRP